MVTVSKAFTKSTKKNVEAPKCPTETYRASEKRDAHGVDGIYGASAEHEAELRLESESTLPHLHESCDVI